MTLSLPATPDVFWQPAPAQSTPSAELPDRADVVVVGAGLVGLTCAHLLAQRGVSVAVLDARHPAAGTTGRSTAKVTLLQGTRASTVLSRHGSQTLGAYVAANQAGLDLVAETAAQLAPGGSRRPRPLHETRDAWTYATSAASARSVRKEHSALTSAGVPAQLSGTPELPFPTTAAVRLPDQIQVHPVRYLQALHGALAAQGVPVAWPHRVRHVRGADGGGLTVVTTEDRTVAASWVVLATLLPFPLRTALFAATRPHRSYVLAAVPEPGAQLPHGMYLSTSGPTHSLRTAADDSGNPVLLVGGDGHPTGKQLPGSAHLTSLAAWAEENFPIASFSHRWSAQDYSSVDELPQFGRAPFGPDRLLVASGFAKWGFTNGSAAALTLAGLVTDDEPEWAAPFRPRLATGARGWAKLVAGQAEVGVDDARGWLVDPALNRGDPAEGDGVVLRTVPFPTAVSVTDGERRACRAVCTHLGGVVRWNDAERSWDCPLHGSRFAVDGSVLEGPATSPLATA